MYINDHLIKELKLKSASDLKASLPLYPTIKREEEGKFSTLVRKRYDGIYYLIPLRFKAENDAKASHGLHGQVYRYLMLGVHTLLDVKDNDQTNEVERLKNL